MNKSEMNGKKVLMFCPQFFGYDKRIRQAMQDAGYEVDLANDRAGDDFLSKVCIRLNLKCYYPVVRNYIRSLINRFSEKKFDYIVVVKGEGVNTEAIALLRDAYPQAEFILYLWDSVANIPECEKRMKLYDRVLTFDPADADKYGIPYLNIPYSQESTEYQATGKFDYDVAFIGTAHSVRPRIVKQIQTCCQKAGRKCYVYLYSPHILVYLFNKITNPDYKWIRRKDVHFKPLTSQQVYKIYSTSKCILDIEHPKQQGTTTRPVEMLPMKKKIITTNGSVRNFPFYNENNFCIIDRDHLLLDISFFDTEYVPIDEKIIQQYSPGEFVRMLLN